MLWSSAGHSTTEHTSMDEMTSVALKLLPIVPLAPRQKCQETPFNSVPSLPRTTQLSAALRVFDLTHSSTNKLARLFEGVWCVDKQTRARGVFKW